MANNSENALAHLHRVLVSMMKDIDELCKQHQIEYYLMGGSAIGAVRHKGFIPWDDDLDIIMTADNYEKFIEACKFSLDSRKYYLQVGGLDWSLEFSKVRLLGTRFVEKEGYSPNKNLEGIYVDVFKMDNVSNRNWIGYWQYLCAKWYLCYQLSVRTYQSASFSKQVMMACAWPLRWNLLRRFVVRQVTMYNGTDTDFLGFFYGRTRWKSAVVERRVFGKPTYVPFEDIMLPIAEHSHEYLTQVFGDYMTLPPVEQRKGLHVIHIDFGKY